MYTICIHSSLKYMYCYTAIQFVTAISTIVPPVAFLAWNNAFSIVTSELITFTALLIERFWKLGSFIINKTLKIHICTGRAEFFKGVFMVWNRPRVGGSKTWDKKHEWHCLPKAWRKYILEWELFSFFLFFFDLSLLVFNGFPMLFHIFRSEITVKLCLLEKFL